MIDLSVVIITFNEERNVDRCLRSVKELADEVVIVDSFSKDKTVDLCRSLGARVVEHLFEGHIEQKNFALSQAHFPYVLSLDADEEVSAELLASILSIKSAWSHDAYEMSRMTNYCGSWIRHGGWYPDRKVRLFDKRKAGWGGTNPHDRVVLNDGATVMTLKGDLLHYSYYNLSDHIRQIDYFTGISAQTMFDQGRRPSLIKMILGPIVRFVRDYILKSGFMDGYAGLTIAVLSAQAVFIKYSKLRQLYESR
ncbi:MAG: glycosyltransferase family 2 protein [Bacteroidota bacterium]